MPIRYALVAAFAVLVLWLLRSVLDAGHKRKLAHANYFDDVASLFDRVVTRQEPSGYPRMTGHMGSHAFDLQAVADSLTFRKLPALWVMVSLPEALPVEATLDIMARPGGHEPFSHFANLPHSLPCPPFLPDGIAIRSNNAARVLPMVLLSQYAQIFDAPQLKELLISPKGLRIVFLAEEAERGRFLIFRDSEMGLSPLPKDFLAPLLQSLLALQQDVIETARKANA